MPTATGLPKVGEIWTLDTGKIDGRYGGTRGESVVIVERLAGHYWAVRVSRPDWCEAKLWVDASYWKQRGWFRYTGQDAGPVTRRKLGIS